MGIFDRAKEAPARQPDPAHQIDQIGQTEPSDQYATDERDQSIRSAGDQLAGGGHRDEGRGSTTGT